MTILEKLNELIVGIDIAMFTSVHPSGQLHSRPMATQAVSDDGYLWFFARQHSTKIDEIRNDHQVNVAYSDASNMRFVSVSGPCELIRSRPIANALWKPEYEQWFPKGVEDPDLILLKVTINTAEYWDSSAGRMRTLDSENETLLLRDDRTVA